MRDALMAQTYNKDRILELFMGIGGSEHDMSDTTVRDREKTFVFIDPLNAGITAPRS